MALFGWLKKKKLITRIQRKSQGKIKSDLNTTRNDRF